jgi:flagellar FliL protein
MSSAAAEAQPRKKGKMKGILLATVGALVLLAGGVGAGLYAAGAGLVGAHKDAPKEDPNTPKLVLKQGEKAAVESESRPSAPVGIESEQSPDPSKYKASYYTFDQPFTANLRDSDSFAQIGVAAATFYDAKVIENIKNNEMPIRSAILMTIAQQDSFAITTPEGKLKLQKDLKDAVNGILRQREGFGGVDNVYFTSMVIQ